MRRFSIKSPQLTVFACFLFLVMNLQQAWCKTDIVVLYHATSHFYLTMHPNGRVSTVQIDNDNYTPYQCLELNTIDKGNFSLSIYNHKTKRYLCFNKKGNLVGRKKCSEWCQFNETFTADSNGYITFKSVKKHNGAFYQVAFRSSGKSVPSSRITEKDSLGTMFMKMSKCSAPSDNSTHCSKTLCTSVPASANDTQKHLRRHDRKFRKPRRVL